MSEKQQHELIDQCKRHIIETMRSLPDCAPTAVDMRNKQIEKAAGFGLGLPKHDSWFTWSLLTSLVIDGKIQCEMRGGKGAKHYRLK